MELFKNNLVDKAWDILDNVEMQNGFEVWRQVLESITQKSPAEIIRLEFEVMNPKECSKMNDLPQAIVAWETAHRNWVDAGGDGLDDHKTVGALLSLLPWDIKERALWDYELYKDDPARLKRWVKDKVKLLNSWKVGRGGTQGAHALEVPKNSDQEDYMDGLFALPEDADDEDTECPHFPSLPTVSYPIYPQAARYKGRGSTTFLHIPNNANAFWFGFLGAL